MKEELQGKLVEILTSMQTAAGKATDFAATQLPDIAMSYIVYGRVYSVIWLLGAVGVFVALWYFFQWMRRINAAEDGHPAAVVGVVCGGLAVCLNFLNFWMAVNNVALVWFAQKVWLLKEIAGMLK